ncbi:MAG TPA: LD-carboxypeptidase [Chthonomonadaceae bacterium]|nr:LD-carboxypeptidase [Chthonomonadaceae bacterium]
MNRDATGGALLDAGETKEIVVRKPRRLARGDLIGVVAPASPVPAEDLAKGVALIEERGYRVRLGEHVLARAEECDYLAGPDAQRAADLNRMFADPEVAAIFCARGGYGSMRLFRLLDWDRIAESDKLFVGYSDVTSLHTALASFGRATVHATMVSSLWKLGAAALEQFWRLVETTDAPVELPADPDAVQTVVPGVAEGELSGGNLCLLTQACGSRFQPDFRGKIVLLEDVHDAIYHADRDLTQLLNAGVLQQAAGFVAGCLTGWQKHEADPPLNTPAKLWQGFFSRLGRPAVADFPFGHEPDPIALPLGVRARLDASSRTLTLLESAVSDGD